VSSIALKMDTATIERGFRECPKIMAKYVTEGIKRVLLGFRKDFFAKTPVNLTRLGRTRFWPIDVKNVTKLGDISGSLRTGSPVAFAHETGATIKPTGGRKKIAEPIMGARGKGLRRKKEFSSPFNVRRQLLTKYVTIRTRRGNLVLKPKEFSRGRKWVLGKAAWLLVDEIKLKPRLQFIEQWEKGLPEAERRFGERIDDAVKEAFEKKGISLRAG